MQSEEPWPALKVQTEEKRDGGGTLQDHDPEVRCWGAEAMRSAMRADTHYTIVKFRDGCWIGRAMRPGSNIATVPEPSVPMTRA